eukprot:5335861-Pyramimonas_sp.AAC.1
MFKHPLGFTFLRGARASAFRPDADVSEHTWRCVSGPIGAMKSSLQRIQWDMQSFVELANDFGEVIRPT